MLATREGDGFQARVHAERAEQMPDVVSDGLGAEVQLARDLLGRMAAPQQAQDFGLARREMRREEVLRLFLDIRDLAEDADEPVAFHERAGADVDLNAIAVGLDEDD